ncbi:MAG: DUF5615 family PIN-like protein [Lentisphaerae bacterium]|nr:DUF5615 family PIN-like protein [Lentisphaerota bacterium]
MRFLIDAQLPPSLARFIESRGQEAKAVREVELRDTDDARILAFAQQGGWWWLPRTRISWNGFCVAMPVRRLSGSESATARTVCFSVGLSR